MLRSRGLPRLQMALIVATTGAVGFLASAVLLALGVSVMAVRYPGAVLVAYGSFLLLLRGWARRGRGRAHEHVQSALDAPHVDLAQGASSAPPATELGGGAFGGGGAGGGWGDAADGLALAASPMVPAADAGGEAAGASAASALEVDLDEGWLLVAPIVLVGGAVLAALVAVYTAPALLAEILLDIALASGLYRRLQHLERRSWLRTAMRHTWFPAVATALVLAFAGFVAQDQLPEARSIGDVLRALR